jgi:hypothetical protein
VVDIFSSLSSTPQFHNGVNDIAVQDLPRFPEQEMYFFVGTNAKASIIIKIRAANYLAPILLTSGGTVTRKSAYPAEATNKPYVFIWGRFGYRRYNLQSPD